MNETTRPTETTRPPSPRKAYERPLLRRIKLTAEEVLASGCKSTSGFNGFQGPGCLPGGCHSTGS